jgi:hypothetical protein
VPTGVTTDLAGNPRFVDDTETPDTGSGTAPLVDMGAYEYQPVAARWLYVNGGAAPGGDGLSWATAYQYLQDALTGAQADPAVTEIWVAGGTYKPDRDAAHPGGTGSRTTMFQLIPGVAVRGGFAGDESPATFELADRDFATNRTVLSGDLAGNDGSNFANNGENSYHVVTVNSFGSAGVLDGFTISGGNANGVSPNNLGGGLYTANGNPSVTNCVFSGNTATVEGGGLYTASGNPSVTNCVFSGNASYAYGGGLHIHSGNPSVTNCVFSGNAATVEGGGVYNDSQSAPKLTNCTFSGNSAGAGGGLCDYVYPPAVLTNCILWGNAGGQISGPATVTYSCVQGGWSGTGNISANPLFVNAASGNLRLQGGSPCIDAGNNTAVPADTLDLDGDGNTTEPLPFDLDGSPRFHDDPAVPDTGSGTPPIVDMGAYEGQYGAAWVLRSTMGPLSRLEHAMAYDSNRGVTVLYGGLHNPSPVFGDTWEWDGVTWSRKSTDGPGPRTYVAMAYDSARKVCVLFGGAGDSDTWEWDGNTWTLKGNTGPSPRAAHAMAYDSARGVIVLFGGWTTTPNDLHGDTWEWDGVAWTLRATSGPSPRQLPGMAYDAGHGVTVLFGGKGSAGLLADTWTWDGNTWTPVPIPGPSPRDAWMVYDNARGLIVLFGGFVGPCQYPGDTWELDGAWTQVNLPGPTPRGLHGMAYDSARGVTVLFGGEVCLGGSAGNNGETWEYWTAVPDVLLITAHTPRGLSNQAASHVGLAFSRAVNASSFTTGDIAMTGPGGPIAIDAPQDQGNNVWRVSFPVQSTDGVYHVRVGPHITDLNDQEMDQNRNGIPGEDPGDVYDASFTIDMTPPAITAQTPSGEVHAAVDHIDVTFSEPINVATFTAADVVLTGPGGAIAVGAPVNQNGNVWRISFAAQSAVGEYTLTVGPDIEDVAGNAMAQPYVGGFSIALPDLAVSNPDVPGSGCTGSSLDVGWRVTNTGNAAATATWQDCVYLSSDDQPGNDTQLICMNRPVALDPNEWYERIATVTVPGVAAGQYWIIIKADAASAVQESTEANNVVVAGPITISRPNLVISNPTVEPQDTWPGGVLNVGWTVTNDSPCAAVGTWQDYVFLSTDDQPGGDTQLSSIASPAGLVAGGQYARTAAVTLPAVSAGNYWIVIKVDNAGAIPETDEGDNTTVVGPISVQLPNLTVGSLVLPQEGWTGQQVDIAWTVTNDGSLPAAGTWQDCVYLSTNAQIGGDTQLGCLNRPVDLAAGGHYDRVGTVTIPAVPEGDYWIVVKADAAGTLPETDEGDNAAIAGPIPIHVTPCPDLQPSNVVIQAEAVAGGSAGVDWVVTNVGNGATSVPSWTDRVYLSTNQVLDGNDRSVGDFQNAMALNVGDPYSQHVQFAVPTDLLGNYYVIVLTDSQSKLTECDENNNVAVSSTPIQIQPVVTPTLMIKNVQAKPSSPWPGDPVSVTWTITNTGNIATGQFTVDHTIVLSTDDNINTTADNRTLAAQVTPLTANLNAAQTSDSLSVSVNIPLDTWGSRFIFVVPHVVQGAGLNVWPTSVPVQIQTPVAADLVIDQANVNPHGISGEPAHVTWRVRNAANSTTLVANWQDAVILSQDASLATTADNQQLGTFTHSGALSFDQFYDAALDVTLPNSASGPYYIFVCADSANQVYEGPDGESNCTPPNPIDIEYRAADLQSKVTAVLADGVPASSVLSGSQLTVQWTVTNAGNALTRSGGWSDRIYISADSVLGSDDPVLATVYHSGALNPGTSYAAAHDVTIPLSFTAPQAFIFVCADCADQVYESDNANNCAVSPAAFEVTWGPADLRVAAVSASYKGQPLSSIPSGATVTVHWQVVNDGPGATAVGSWQDRIYLSADEYLDGTDTLLATVSHSGVVPAPGEYAASCAVQIPIGFTAPAAYIFVLTDCANSVVESDDANNTSRTEVPFEVVWGPPDLTVQSISAVHGPLHTQVANVSWIVNNLGGPTVATQWLDKVYLSPDRWLSADDVEVVTPDGPLPPHVGALALGQTYYRTESVIVPAGATGYLIVVTDAADQVVESNEENNTAYTGLPSLNCDSDLVVTEIDVPPSALSGQIMSVHWRVANQGGQPTNVSSWRDAVYLSRDQYLDPGSDLYVGYLDHSGVLAAGAVYDPLATLDVRIPSGLTGPYYVFVVIDINHSVCESDQTNNVSYHGVAVQVELPPPTDLVVTSIAPPATGQVGQSAVIDWTVRNQGDFEAQGAWTDSVYLSADTTWDIHDAKVGELRHNGPLAAGAEYHVGLATALPGVVPGAYHVIVRTDIRNEVRESAAGEQNNIAVSTETIQVDVPPLPLVGTIARKQSVYGRIDVAADQTLRITLDCDSPTGANRVYVRYGQVPDQGRFDFMSTNPFDPDQTVTVPTTQAGTYYVLLYCDSLPASSVFRLTAEPIPFSIESVTPPRIGNNGQVTITLHGARFQEGAEVLLVGTGNVVLNPVKVMVLDSATAKARFFFENAPHGPCIAEIRNPDQTVAAKPQAVTIETATPITVTLIPSGNLAPRVGSVLRIDGTLANTGNVDVPYVAVIFRFGAAVRVGWWRPGEALPRQEFFADANWQSDSPTARVVEAETHDRFVMRDAEPGTSIPFVARVSGFGAGPFELRLFAMTYTADEFEQTLYDSAERMRQDMLGSDLSQLAPEAIALVHDAVAWREFVKQGLVDQGFLDADSATLRDGYPAATRAALAGIFSKCNWPELFNCLVQKGEKAAGMHVVCKLAELTPYGVICLVWEVVDGTLDLAECYIDWCWNVPPCKPGQAGFGGSGQGCGTGTVARDPNEKEGPPGYGPQAFVGAQSLPYAIDFENVPAATAWARQVTITDQLGPDLDWRTVQLGEIAFGDTVIQVPNQRPHYAGDTSLPNGLIARVNAGVDIQTGIVTWTITAIDPATGEMTENALLGLLPPNDPATHSGEGHVTYTIKPKAGVPTGTEIRNHATIIFDNNEPIETNEVFNTIDADAPSSSVTALPPVTATTEFPLAWSGEDDPGGCGVESYTVYASVDNGPFAAWTTMEETSAPFTGRGGGTYAFYSVARDYVGNVEPAPEVPDAITTVAVQTPAAPQITALTPFALHLASLGSANMDYVEHAVVEETTGKYVSADGLLVDAPVWRRLDEWPALTIRGLQASTAYRFKAKARSAAGTETPFGAVTAIKTGVRVRGDMDCDGAVTFADINPFVRAILGQQGYESRYPNCAWLNGDINGDGAVDFDDINPFVRCIAAGGCPPLLGDLNCDGGVDFDDINPFVVALISRQGYEAKYPGCTWLNGDINGDGSVSFDDIDPFVACLVAGGCP